MKAMAFLALPIAAIMVIFGEVEHTQLDAYTGPIASGSAVGILGWAVWYLLTKVLPQRDEQLEKAQLAFMKTLDAMAERHERWETQRHADSQAISESLSGLSVNCARTRTRMEQEADDRRRSGDDV